MAVRLRRVPVKMRQRIRRVRYLAPTTYGVELMTLEQLAEIAPPGYLETPQRPAFHVLILGTGGCARQLVDFREHAIEPGRAVWVRPGQVQRFDPHANAAGVLVLFRPDFLIPGTRAELFANDRFGPVEYGPAQPRPAGLEAARRALQRGHDAALASGGADTVIAAERLRHLLSLLILELAPNGAEDQRPGVEDETALALHRRFRDLLERDFSVAHDVEHYARALGYSSRTLSRATGAATGQTPKQMIQERLALEAGRLLAHSSQPVSAIAAQLGFADASNFASFFTKQMHVTPTAFRARERG